MSKSLGEKIRKRLGAFAAALENRESISERFTCRTIKLQLEPQSYGPQQVKGTRKLLGVSQAIFAQFLGVSVKSVSAWEQARRIPVTWHAALWMKSATIHGTGRNGFARVPCARYRYSLHRRSLSPYQFPCFISAVTSTVSLDSETPPILTWMPIAVKKPLPLDRLPRCGHFERGGVPTWGGSEGAELKHHPLAGRVRIGRR